MQKCIPVELGVCQRQRNSLKEQGQWSYYTVPVPATTPFHEIQNIATREFLNKYDDIFVHHTWIQNVGPEMILEQEGGNFDTL